MGLCIHLATFGALLAMLTIAAVKSKHIDQPIRFLTPPHTPRAYIRLANFFLEDRGKPVGEFRNGWGAEVGKKAKREGIAGVVLYTVVGIVVGENWYTWDAVTSVNLNISMVRELRRHLVCIRQIVYMNKNGGF